MDKFESDKRRKKARMRKKPRKRASRAACRSLAEAMRGRAPYR
jgi:hypothetical protein